jgi:hypothetical protein
VISSAGGIHRHREVRNVKRMKDRRAEEEPRIAAARSLVPFRDRRRETEWTVADVLGRFMRG